MGWSSANKIFDPIAQALIDLSADGPTKCRLLAPLIRGLQEGDWDTEIESLERFANDPDIVAAFAQRGVALPFATIDVPPQDEDAVRLFAKHRIELRIARAQGTRLCGVSPLDDELAWLTCTDDPNHEGEHSWYRDCP